LEVIANGEIFNSDVVVDDRNAIRQTELAIKNDLVSVGATDGDSLGTYLDGFVVNAGFNFNGGSWGGAFNGGSNCWVIARNRDTPFGIAAAVTPARNKSGG
jgi:hypothetical protein